MTRLGSWSDHFRLAMVVALCVVPGLASSQGGEPAATNPPQSSERGNHTGHRFDLGLQRVESPVGDFFTTMFGYTTTFAGDMSFSTGVTFNQTTNYTPSQSGASETYHIGLGDTVLIYSFLPGQKITASPWVPRSIGLSAMLVLPTGKAEDFLGGDQFVFSPQAGWVVELGRHFSLLPAIRYTTTFAEGELAVPAHQLSAELGLVWAHPQGWWINYTGEIVRDFEQDDWDYNDAFSVGKMFGQNFGVSVAYGILERTDPNASRNDFEWMLLFHHVMGNRDSN